MTKSITEKNNSIDDRIPKTHITKIKEEAVAGNLKYTVQLEVTFNSLS